MTFNLYCFTAPTGRMSALNWFYFEICRISSRHYVVINAAVDFAHDFWLEIHNVLNVIERLSTLLKHRAGSSA